VKCYDGRKRRGVTALAARKAKAARGAARAMTFSSLSDQDHIMAIILRLAEVNRRHPTGPYPCQREPSSLHLRSDTVDLSVRKR
jgi:hypothetical protein